MSDVADLCMHLVRCFQKAKAIFLLKPSVIENDIKIQLIESWNSLVKLLGLEHH